MTEKEIRNTVAKALYHSAQVRILVLDEFGKYRKILSGRVVDATHKGFVVRRKDFHFEILMYWHVDYIILL